MGAQHSLAHQSNLNPVFSYHRIETLSGFANGVFLLLISLFIVFEAVERL
jgi:Co/Zn/Cd efflux system component